MYLNSIVFFKKSGNEYWEYKRNDEIMKLTQANEDDFMVYQTIGDDIIYKMNEDNTLNTTLLCGYNYRYFTEEKEEDQKLDNRNCTKCREKEPFSYGFESDKCEPCSKFVGFIENAEEYLKYFYSLDCAGY